MSSQPPPWQSRWPAPPPTLAPPTLAPPTLAPPTWPPRSTSPGLGAPPTAPWGSRAQWGGAAASASGAPTAQPAADETGLDQGWLRVAGQQGSVPLRPLAIVELLDGGFATIRTRPLVMMGTGAVLATLTAVASAVPGWVGDPQDWLTGDSFVDGCVRAAAQVLLTTLVAWVAASFLAPLVTDAALGRHRSGAELRALWRGRWPALLVQPLVAAAVVVVGALPFAAGVALMASGSDGGGFALAIVGLLAWVLGWLPSVAGRTTVAAPSLLTEGLGPVRSLLRAWRLTRRSFWRVLWIQVLAWLLSAIALVILILPAIIVAGILSPDEAPAASAGRRFAADAVMALGEVAAMSVLLPFLACVLGLIHLDLRLRREGLAVRLLQHLGRSGAAGRPGRSA